MANSSESEDDTFMAVDPEEAVAEGIMEQDEEPRAKPEEAARQHNRSMGELPEEVLEYILSFLSPYQEHKTAALVCKQWYRLIKGTRGGVLYKRLQPMLASNLCDGTMCLSHRWEVAPHKRGVSYCRIHSLEKLAYLFKKNVKRAGVLG